MNELIDTKPFEEICALLKRDISLSCTPVDHIKYNATLLKMAHAINRMQKLEESDHNIEPECKNCPFCGKQPSITETNNSNWDVRCSNDNCMVQPCLGYYRKNKIQAVNAWNNRS